MSKSFPENIREVSRREAGGIKSITIDLAIVQADFEYALSGNFFYVWEAPDGTSIDIKINETRESAITYVEQTGARTPFDKLYITTPAGQVGDLILVYGTESPGLVEMLDNRGSISGDLATIRDELQGDAAHENYGGVTMGVAAAVALAANVARKGCWFHSLSTNTNNIFLGFTNAVTAGGAPGTWAVELLPGTGWGVDDYRGVVYGISGAANQYLGTGEW